MTREGWNDIEELRQEIAALRREIADLRGSIFPQPAPHIPMPIQPLPTYPGAPWPAVASAKAMRDTWCWNGGQPLMGGTDWSKTSGPNSP